MANQVGGIGRVQRCAGPRDGVSDANLVKRFKQGDKSAYDTLASRHLPAVNAVVCCTLFNQRGRVDPETRDRLVHEALVKACISIRQCRQPQRFAWWLRRIAVRVVADDGRALNRKRELHASQLQGSSGITFDEMCEDPRYGKGGVLDIVAAAEEVAALTPIVRRAVGNLSPRQRQVVTLWYREGMTNKEIAQKTGLNEHTVSSHLCVGRKRLRQLLDGAENDGLQGRKKATAAGRPGARRAEPRAASAPMSRVSGISAKGAKARPPHHRSVEGETYRSQ